MLSIAEEIALAALGLNIIVAVVGLTWGLGKVREAVRSEVRDRIEAAHKIFNEKIESAYKMFNDRIEAEQKDFSENIDTIRHEFGETVGAIREKVREVELWTRDNLVKKDSFSAVTDRISREVRDLGERLDKRLERMEGKIDHP